MIREPVELVAESHSRTFRRWDDFLARLPPFRDRIVYGVAFLDCYYMGWVNRIQRMVDVGRSDSGIAEQAIGPKARRYRSGTRSFMDSSCQRGSCRTRPTTVQCDELSREWRIAISGRLRGGVFPSFRNMRAR